jgi:hypothetical protein
MKLAFRPYVDRRIRTSNVAWASNLRQAAPGLRGELEVKLDCASMWLGGPCCSSTPLCSSPCVLWTSPWFLITLKKLGSKLFLQLLIETLRSELTSKFNCHARALVIGR